MAAMQMSKTAGMTAPRRAAPAFRPAMAPKPMRSVVRAAAAESAPAETEQKEWYALVANQEFFFNDVQNEAIAEQLRERIRFFKEKDMETDFYLVPNPVWLDAKFPAQAKQVRRPCVALVSTDKYWIVFMKLRLDRVLKIDLGDMETAEVLKAGGAVEDSKAPEKWTAPYSPYSKGWWVPFLPQ